MGEPCCSGQKEKDRNVLGAHVGVESWTGGRGKGEPAGTMPPVLCTPGPQAPSAASRALTRGAERAQWVGGWEVRAQDREAALALTALGRLSVSEAMSWALMAASLVAAVSGVARSWTRRKPLSGSGSSRKSAAFTDHGGNPNSARGKRLTVFLVVLHMQFDLLFLFNKNIIKHQLIPCPTPSRKNNSVQFSCSVLSNPLRPHGLQHARPPCPSPTPGVYSNWCPLSQ